MNPISQKTGLKCLVFSTNIDTKLKAARLVYVLERTQEIRDWNLDMDDRDHVLRIDFKSLNISSLEKKLFSFDISIEELPIW